MKIPRLLRLIIATIRMVIFTFRRNEGEKAMVANVTCNLTLMRKEEEEEIKRRRVVCRKNKIAILRRSSGSSAHPARGYYRRLGGNRRRCKTFKNQILKV